MAFRKNNTYKYDPGNTFKLSRSGIDSFIKCKRCFYLNKVGNIKDIGMPGFSLNSAHDELMKKELDIYSSITLEQMKAACQKYLVDSKGMNITIWKKNKG